MPHFSRGVFFALSFAACVGDGGARRSEPVKKGSRPAECMADAGCPAGTLCIYDRCAPIGFLTGQCFGLRVPFATGITAIDQAARQAIERLARCLRAGHGPVVLLTEHTPPPRPVPVVPIPTGDARATAVDDELERLGVPAEQRRRAHYTTGYHLACPGGRDGCAERQMKWGAEALAPPGQAPAAR